MRGLLLLALVALSLAQRWRTMFRDVQSDVHRVFQGPPRSSRFSSMLLVSSEEKSCSEPLFSLRIPLGRCLNNHDFNAVPCHILRSCIPPKGGVMDYEKLVECTGAPSMRLSVKQEIDPMTGRLRALIYPLSKSCRSVPIPFHYGQKACASLFAVSKSCGIAGAAIDWE